jgi:hypothetical protein
VFTIIMLCVLWGALRSEENHPLFPSPDDPVEREVFARQWRDKKVSEAIWRVVIFGAFDIFNIVYTIQHLL